MIRAFLAVLIAAMLPWTGARVVPTQTTATIVRDGAPFFVWGAAFFYERMPRESWASSLALYKRYGITTIDLYIPWNWHELADGDFDFDGHTNPRRDLRGLLRMIHDAGFAVVVRPGPVIRNEWRNGGYPAWLLTRPEYDMPLHDVLEGRYPATATLQNAHSDDAAAEWMRNATHMRYATRWLHRVARELRPFAHDVIAWQLDDDQGAYIDNQTWPAPHLVGYLDALAAIVRSDVGPTLPLFINTYDMKVPASSPVLAFGNWYQSEAYEFGEHDRTELEFATALLQTQPHAPIVASEFQAGWLQGPGDAYPRAVDPANTELALHTLLQLGAHGVIDFPLQDTLAPAGWEAPFSNAFYDWDAAIGFDGTPQPRSVPTAAFGRLIAKYGRDLARAHRVVDAAIVWPVSAYDEHAITNDDIFAAVARTKEALRFCRAASLTCDLVDLRYADDKRLAAYPIVIVPRRGARLAMRPREAQRLAALAMHRTVEGDDASFPSEVAPARARADALLARARIARAIDGIPDAVLLATDDVPPKRFIDVVNLTTDTLNRREATIRAGHDHVSTIVSDVAGRQAMLLPLDAGRELAAASPAAEDREARARKTTDAVPNRSEVMSLRDDVAIPIPPPPYRFLPSVSSPDVFHDGAPPFIIGDRHLRIVVSPAAGGRIVALIDPRDGFNRMSTAGGLRDDVTVQTPPSRRDFIAKYTHDYPAGFFNRLYQASEQHTGGVICASATVRETYTATDVVGGPLTIEKTIRFGEEPQAVITMTGRFADTAPPDQHVTSRFSLAGGPPGTRASWLVATPDERSIPPGATIDVAGHGFAFFGAGGRATLFHWRADEGITARIVGRADDVDVLLTFAGPSGEFVVTTALDPTPSDRLVFAAPLLLPDRPLRGSCL